jgi:hypothetical protein
MPAPSGFDHVSTTKSNSTRSIAAHPCKKKDGAPSVGMVHAKIVKGWPPAQRRTGGASSVMIVLQRWAKLKSWRPSRGFTFAIRLACEDI